MGKVNDAQRALVIKFLKIFYISNESDIKIFLKWYINKWPKGICESDPYIIFKSWSMHLYTPIEPHHCSVVFQSSGSILVHFNPFSLIQSAWSIWCYSVYFRPFCPLWSIRPIMLALSLSLSPSFRLMHFGIVFFEFLITSPLSTSYSFGLIFVWVYL